MICYLRSIGERTEKIAYDILKEEMPVVLVKNMSLSDSTRFICEEALKSGQEWTLFADADIIPEKGYATRFHEIAKNSPPEVMAVKGWIKDKFLMEQRGLNGGSFLYRTDLLQTWLDVFDLVDNQRTTEPQCYKVLKKQGYRFEQTDIFVGLHDYEQHYHDIFRSCFVYGKKKKSAKKLMRRWEKLSKDDKDFEVCLYAYQKGREYTGQVKADFRIDYGFKESPFKDWMKDGLERIHT